MQTSASSNEVYCTGLEDTFHDPTEVTNEQSPPGLSNSTDEERQGGDGLASEDSDSENASDNSKRRKLGPALFSIHLQERHMLTRSAVEFVEETTTSLIRGSLLHVRGEVLNILQSSGLDIEIFDREMNPFEGIDSFWLKEQFIKKHFPYVVSVNIIVFTS